MSYSDVFDRWQDWDSSAVRTVRLKKREKRVCWVCLCAFFHLVFAGRTDLMSAVLILALLEKSRGRTAARLQTVSINRQNFRNGEFTSFFVLTEICGVGAHDHDDFTYKQTLNCNCLITLTFHFLFTFVCQGNETLVTKTTVTVPVNGGPVEAVSTIETVPYWTRSRRKTGKIFILMKFK